LPGTDKPKLVVRAGKPKIAIRCQPSAFSCQQKAKRKDETQGRKDAKQRKLAAEADQLFNPEGAILVSGRLIVPSVDLAFP